MNRKECLRLAQQKYGPGASPVNVSSKDRHQRFGIMFYVPAGALDHPVLGCLGFGDSYQSAWQSAEKNPTAQAVANEWKRTQEDYESFRVDPQGYRQKRMAEIAAVMQKGEQETNNG